MSYLKLAENHVYEAKTLIRIMKMAYIPPTENVNMVNTLDEDEKNIISKINQTTVILLRIKYLFTAFKYSLNVMISGNKVVNAPNSIEGFNAMISVYGRKFSDDVVKAMRLIVLHPNYGELKKISTINPDMYLTIIKDIDHDKLEEDFNSILLIFKEYFEKVLMGTFMSG